MLRMLSIALLASACFTAFPKQPSPQVCGQGQPGCAPGSSCQAGRCSCAPETTAELCGARRCGALAAIDRCGGNHALTCGACDVAHACNASGVCAPLQTCTTCSCVPESDASLCTRLGKVCGALTATDNCGATRNAVSCGACGATQICDATTGQCGCEQEVDLCARLIATCGPLDTTDACTGVPRHVVACGVCSSSAGQSCVNSRCTPNCAGVASYARVNAPGASEQSSLGLLNLPSQQDELIALTPDARTVLIRRSSNFFIVDRASQTDPFPAPVDITGSLTAGTAATSVSTSDGIKPTLTADGLALIAANQALNCLVMYRRTARDNGTSAFTFVPSSPVASLCTVNASDTLRLPALSGDGLTLLVHETVAAGDQILAVQRASTANDFGFAADHSTIKQDFGAADHAINGLDYDGRFAFVDGAGYLTDIYQRGSTSSKTWTLLGTISAPAPTGWATPMIFFRAMPALDCRQAYGNSSPGGSTGEDVWLFESP